MRCTITLLFFCATTNIVFAQALLKGQIIDTATNSPIEGVNISIEGTNQGTTTDATGAFELAVERFPILLRCSHIAYESHELAVERLPNKPLELYLIPKVSMLDEVVVEAEQGATPLSEATKYSLLDFELLDNHILRLEYHGSFQKRVLSLTDLDGVVQHKLTLKHLKGINGLYKSCIDMFYLLGRYAVHPIVIQDTKLSLQKPMALDTFQAFIAPCKVQEKDELYFVYEDLNGLRRTITAYDVTSKNRTEIRQIANLKMVQSYMSDMGLIQQGQTISNIRTNDPAESRRIRRLQAGSDFLSEVFYKPEMPVYIFKKKGHLLLFNHPEKKVEIYRAHQLQGEAMLDYVEDNTWQKQLLYDAYTARIYGLFKTKNATLIKEINVMTGETTPVATLAIESYRIQKARIHNRQIYYLQSERMAGQNQVLMRQAIVE